MPAAEEAAYRRGWLDALAHVAVAVDDYHGRSYVARELAVRVQRLAGRRPRGEAGTWPNVATAAAAAAMLNSPAHLPALRAGRYFQAFVALAFPDPVQRPPALLLHPDLDKAALDELVADHPEAAGDAPDID